MSEKVENEREEREIDHWSHEHPLTLVEAPGARLCYGCLTSFRRGEKCYECSQKCGYYVLLHEDCVEAPRKIRHAMHPQHTLTQQSSLDGVEEGRCSICQSNVWGIFYRCTSAECAYMMHIRCAQGSDMMYGAEDEERSIIHHPSHPNHELKLFRRFCTFKCDACGTTHAKGSSYTCQREFHHHKLTLVSSSSSSFQEENEEEEEEDDDDEEDYSCRKSELICDGCITPILVKQAPSSSSSSSSEEYNYYYMRCSIRSCKYYLHLECFQLPPQLSSLPLLHEHDHSLVLRSGDILKPWQWQRCSICDIDTNGLYYACAKCKRFKVDIKCASMPDTIHHAAHHHHSLNLLSQEDSLRRGFYSCDACNYSLILGGSNSYACDSCDFIVHFDCAALPASTTSRRWDKHHPLLLMHDATLNHPGDFYCDQCEIEMNPRSWMYHCRACDLSFDPICFETTSGRYRNIKFRPKGMLTEGHSSR